MNQLFWAMLLGSLCFNLQAQDVQLINEQAKAQLKKLSTVASIVEGYHDNGRLKLQVYYGGGCATHTFYYGLQAGLSPDTLEIEFFHDDKNDRCEALIHRELSLDLTSWPKLEQVKCLKLKQGNMGNTLGLYPVFNRQKKNLDAAEALIKTKFYPKAEDKLKISEIENPELWTKMGTQIFRVENREILFYALEEEQLTLLGGHYSYDLDILVSDLDQNGQFECIYSYQFGSGVSRAVLGGYGDKALLDIDESCVIPSKHSMAYFKFRKQRSDYLVSLQAQDPKETVLMSGFLVLKGQTLSLKARPE